VRVPASTRRAHIGVVIRLPSAQNPCAVFTSEVADALDRIFGYAGEQFVNNGTAVVLQMEPASVGWQA
jgi:hypothetical protein